MHTEWDFRGTGVRTHRACMPTHDAHNSEQNTSVGRVTDNRIGTARDKAMVLPNGHLEGEQSSQFTVTLVSDESTQPSQESAR